MENKFSLGFCLIAGFLSFFSPCILPLIPVYLSYITGISVEELKKTTMSNFKILSYVLFFIAGFTLIFVMMGASATFIGNFLIRKKDILRIIGGAVVVFFGLHLSGVFKIKKLYTEKRIIKTKSKKIGYLSSFLFGIAFSAGWTPCVGPVLSSILLLAASEKTVGKGILLLFFYSLGIGIPFILAALLVSKIFSLFEKIKKHSQKIETITGILLILFGTLMIFNKINFIF